MNKIPYGRQHITAEDIQAVVETLQSDYLTQGPHIPAFEEAFAAYTGSRYALAVSNGTAALHLCALALNVQPGDKVITTPITFVASANCVRFCGGEVVFADIDPRTLLLDIKSVRHLLEAAPRATYKGIIPVDFSGRAVDLEAFRALADEYGLWMIEDACHAPGGFFVDSRGEKQYCGNGRFAELAIFSFHPVKHIACGEGGMITTNDEELYKQLLRLRSHGITKGDDPYSNSAAFANGWLPEAENETAPPNPGTVRPEVTPTAGQHSPRRAKESTESEAGTLPESTGQDYPAWYMEMQQLGYNYRLTDIQAALGLSQLKRADEGLARRRQLAARYYEALKDLPAVRQQSFGPEGNAYHLYVIEAVQRRGLYDYLRSCNILTQIHYIPAHLMPYYRQYGWQEGDLPAAEEYYRHCLSLPMYPTLSDEQQDYVIGCIRNYYQL